MISVLPLAPENWEREGDRNQETDAQNLNEGLKHTYPFLKKYQMFRKKVKEGQAFAGFLDTCWPA